VPSLSYEGEKYLEVKLCDALQNSGVINTFCKSSQVQNDTALKLYDTVSLPTLLYESENLTMNAKDKIRITAAEMKFDGLRHKNNLI
jgi:hypothetical protein